MHGRRRHDIPAVPTQIDALSQAGAIVDQSPGVREIQVPSAAAGRRLDGRGQRPEPALQPRQ